MIGYGAAFVVGWLFTVVMQTSPEDDNWRWLFRPVVWGGIFMGLNWIATLG